MSCIQITPNRLQPSSGTSKNSPSSGLPSKPCLLPIRSNVSKYSQCLLILKKYKLRAPVCLFGGIGKPKNDSEGSPFKSLEASMGSFEKKSIEDILREQIEKQEYAVDPYGSGGGKPPRSRGGGGGGGDSSGGSKEEDLNEALQVILATIGFVLVYLSTIHGEDMLLLARDYFRFLGTGHRTVRLRKVMEWFGQRWPTSRKRMAQRKSIYGIEDEDENNDEDEYAYQ